MKKSILTSLFLFALFSSTSFSKDVTAVQWSRDGNTAYNSCMMILSFICTLDIDVSSDVANASINQYLVIYNKNKKLVKKFKVKKIEYKNGRCWLTPQPIRRYTTYFTTDNCKVVND